MLSKIIAAGALVVVAAAVPNLFAEVVKRDFKEKSEIAKKRARTLQLLKRKEIIRIVYLQHGEARVEITKDGRKLVQQYRLQDMKLSKPAQWDGRWRIMLYDLPQRYQRASRALAWKLRDLGLYQLQKSVWVSPFDFYNELEFICSVFEIPLTPYIHYFTSKEIPTEKRLKNFFDLS